MALTASAEQSSSKRVVLVAAIIGVHLGGIYVLESGLARKLIEQLPEDVQTKILQDKPKQEELPPPPPPPEMAPPPPYVPPPEVAIQAPSISTNAISNAVSEPPPPAPPAATPAPPAPPAVPGTRPKINPSKSLPPDDFYPSAAARDGQEGSVIVKCFVRINGKDGKCSDASVLQSSGFPLLDEAAVKYANQGVKFVPGTNNGAAEAMWYEFKVTFKAKVSR